jgi:hypothetical protein
VKIVLILLIRFYQQVISPLKKTNLPVLSYVFSLCGAGSGKIRRLEGFLAGRKKGFKMSPFSPRWLRPCLERN